MSVNDEGSWGTAPDTPHSDGGDDFGGDDFTGDGFGAETPAEAEFDPTTLKPLQDFGFSFCTFGVPIRDMTADQCWELMRTSATSSVPDVVLFKEGFVNYCRGLYDGNMPIDLSAIEQTMRQENWGIYLIAIPRPIFPQYTVVGMDGTPGLVYTLTFQTAPTTASAKLLKHWPSGPEENLERLKKSGFTVASNAVVCRRCGGVGHRRKECSADVQAPTKIVIQCVYCNENHHARDCKDPRPSFGPKPKTCRICNSEAHLSNECDQRPPETCRNCNQEGHKSFDCPDRAPVVCRRCNEPGHFARDYESASVQTCRNCGSTEHLVRECNQPVDESKVQCFNCDAMGHRTSVCPKQKDYSRIRCKNCRKQGHSAIRCPEAPREAKSEDIAPSVAEEMTDLTLSGRGNATAANDDDSW